VHRWRHGLGVVRAVPLRQEQRRELEIERTARRVVLGRRPAVFPDEKMLTAGQPPSSEGEEGEEVPTDTQDRLLMNGMTASSWVGESTGHLDPPVAGFARALGVVRENAGRRSSQHERAPRQSSTRTWQQ
jgi:hypothetical protein